MRTKEEKKIFSTFLKNLGRNPNSKDFINLAKHFLTRCNSITVYPKLPSILKAYYQQWKNHKLIESLLNAHKLEYYDLLQKLSKPISNDVMDPAASFQKHAAEKIENNSPHTPSTFKKP